MVAENNIIWRLAGSSFRIVRREGRKPMSSMRSASSRTMVCCAGKIDQTPFQIVAETAGGSDHHFGPGLDVAQLPVFSQAAHDNGGADARAFGELFERYIDLDREFPRRAEDEDFDGFAAGNSGEGLNDGDGEREGFAGAGLCGGDHVAAFQQWRNRLGLDGRWSNEFVFSEVGPQCGAEIEFREMIH